MKVKIVFVFAALLLASIEALPANETISDEVKSEVSSPLIEATGEDVSRSKKASEKVNCKEGKTEDGKSFLQCNEEDMDVASSYSQPSGGAYGYSAPSYKVIEKLVNFSEK